jgi:hypothetical protein
MGMFRKKPVVVEAVQFVHHADAEAMGLSMVDDKNHYLCPVCNQSMRLHCLVETKEGVMRACPGDWIITGVKGEVYPCKPDIFAATYEPVEATSG